MKLVWDDSISRRRSDRKARGAVHQILFVKCLDGSA